jgi:murein L,D-transpeptidase YcbB/YkuD
MLLRVCLLAVLLAGCASSPPLAAESARPATRLPAALTGPQAEPQHQAASQRLAAAIATYQAIAAAGGWGSVPAATEPLKPGEIDLRVPALRARLAVTDGVPASAAAPYLYDDGLAAGVRAFQARHGLETDGVVGRATLEALNVPVEARLDAMTRSLAKMARQEPTWGERYIAVNAASATYRYVDGGTVIAGPAIVGKPTWQTPELDSVIDRVDFNPSWTVPQRIAAAEIWPKVRKDKSYLAKHNMTVAGGMIRQQPGSGNPLGQVKFSFDNPYSVYLHDTNRRDLFAKAARHLSHGCVRVADAMTLARVLVGENTGWSEARIDEALAKAGTTRVPLDRPIPVHIVYNTAWVAEDGTINLRPDIYNRDAKQIRIKPAQQLDAD